MSGYEIGNKYGEKLDNFTKETADSIETIVVTWCNSAIDTMRKVIRSKARTGGASVLAQDLYATPVKKSPDSISVEIKSGSDYWNFVDKGVRGVKRNRAGNSPFKFKTVRVSKKMQESFKKYIAATGSVSMTGKKLTRKNKQRQADIINQEAYAMAAATKKSGIRAMKFTEAAINKKTVNQLSKSLQKELTKTITISITR